MRKLYILFATVLVVIFLGPPNEVEAQQDGERFFACVRSGRDFQASIKIVSAKLRRKGEDFEYPQIGQPKTPQQRKFNADVLKIVRKDAAADPNEGYRFSVSYATPEFVSVRLISSFCGASCHVGITSFNFDLKTGKPINRLSELFKPKSSYLTTIASYSVGELRRCGFGEEDDWFREGTRPISKNYDVWSLTSDGVKITFEEYQIAAGAFPGVDVVVPFSHLKGMLRQDVGWFDRIKD